jgi:hypothetical protein
VDVANPEFADQILHQQSDHAFIFGDQDRSDAFGNFNMHAGHLSDAAGVVHPAGGDVEPIRSEAEALNPPYERTTHFRTFQGSAY